MRVVVDISAHGFGHLTQTRCVLEALAACVPELELTIRTAHPREVIAARLRWPFEYHAQSTDVGMLMDDALTVRVSASLEAYRSFHADWPRKVAREAEALAELRPDLLLSNVSYLGLAGAKRAQIPSFAVCSLDWAGVFTAYCAGLPGADAVAAQIFDAYACADAFFAATPHMPMPHFGGGPKVISVGPLAQVGCARRDELRRRLGLPAGRRVGLVSLGGIPTDLPLADWIDLDEIFWLVVGPNPVPAFMRAAHATGWSHADLLASVDVVVTKSGYCTVVEAAASLTDLLVVPRGDWPEEVALLPWARAHARTAVVERGVLQTGDFRAALAAAREAKEPTPVDLTGGAQVAAHLASFGAKLRGA